MLRIVTIQVLVEQKDTPNRHSFVVLDSFTEAVGKAIDSYTDVIYKSARIVKCLDEPFK